MITRENACALLKEHTQKPSLLKHAFAVEAAMRAYAKRFEADETAWGIVGLLHDFDYEKYPTLTDHPWKGAEILRAHHYPEEWIEAILSHAAHTGIPRDNLMKKALFAVDELCGFIIAVAYVRPNAQLSDVSIKSVKKKLKNKRFAAQVDRDDIFSGASELGIDLDAHIETVILALQGIAPQLNL